MVASGDRLGSPRGRIAQHLLDDARHRQARHRLGRNDDAAVAQHGHLVAEAHDLLEDVGHVHDRDVVVAQDSEDPEKTLRGARLECGRGLIEQEHLWLRDERLRDLDQLALGERERAQRRGEIDREAELLEDGTRERRHGPAVDQRPATGLAHREQVREDVEVREQAELLGHDRHALGGSRRPCSRTAPPCPRGAGCPRRDGRRRS